MKEKYIPPNMEWFVIPDENVVTTSSDETDILPIGEI